MTPGPAADVEHSTMRVGDCFLLNRRPIFEFGKIRTSAVAITTAVDKAVVALNDFAVVLFRYVIVPQLGAVGVLTFWHVHVIANPALLPLLSGMYLNQPCGL